MSLFGDIIGGAATIGGGIATATGVGAGIGVPLMIGGLGMIGQSSANDTNQTIASNATNANVASADAANALSMTEFQDQEAYETNMSNTAYQRSVADMKAAGLNPVLAGMNQSSASTPSVSAASPQKATAQSTTVDSEIGAGLSSALQTQQILTDLNYKGTQADLNKALTAKSGADALVSSATAKKLGVDTDAVQSQLKAMAAEAKAREAKAGYDYKASTYDAIMSRANRDSGTARNMVDMLGNVLNLGGSGTRQPPGGSMTIDPNTGEILQQH